jgi:hypothetical protein
MSSLSIRSNHATALIEFALDLIISNSLFDYFLLFVLNLFYEIFFVGLHDGPFISLTITLLHHQFHQNNFSSYLVNVDLIYKLKYISSIKHY